MSSSRDDKDTTTPTGADEFCSPKGEAGEENALREKISELEGALAQQKDDYMRLYANMENQKRRFSQEIPAARDQAVGRFVKDAVLDMLDNLESSLSFNQDENAADGLSLTLKAFQSSLQSQGIEVIDPMHEKFNPQEHEAMSMQPSNEHEKNTIIQVVQKGYRLKQTLIRPARVIVSAPANQGTDPE